MDYTSDSDISEDTRNLVSQGLAGLKRKRSGRIRERLSISNIDTSNVWSSLWREAKIGDISTHGLVSTEAEISNGQNYNNINNKSRAHIPGARRIFKGAYSRCKAHI